MGSTTCISWITSSFRKEGKTFLKVLRTNHPASLTIPDSRDTLLVLFIWSQLWEVQDSSLFPILESCHLIFYTTCLSLVLQVWSKEHHWLAPKGVSAFSAERMVTGIRGPLFQGGDGGEWEKRGDGVLEEQKGMVWTTQEIKKTLRESYIQ